MALNDSTNEVTVRKLSKILVGTDGTGGLLGKTKEALANKQDSLGIDAQGDNHLFLGKTGTFSDPFFANKYRCNGASSGTNYYFKLFRVRKGSTYNGAIEGFVRSGTSARFIVSINSEGRIFVLVPMTGSAVSTNTKIFYKDETVDGSNFTDVYLRLFGSSEFIYGVAAGCNYIKTETPGTEASNRGYVHVYNEALSAETWSSIESSLTEIPKTTMATTNGTSSGNAPVKVDASGNLSAVDFMSSEEIDDLFDAAKDAAMSG